MMRSLLRPAGLVRRGLLSLALCAVLPVVAHADAAPSSACGAPSEALNIEHLPKHLRLRASQGRAIKIVAIGSSSTAGAGATSRAASYPSQLEAELKQRLPGVPITVLNKGINGEEADQMLARFPADVIDEKPDLVIWQVGSNSVLRGHPTPAAVIRLGVEMLKTSGADVILMNPQYAPKILAKSEAAHTIDAITATARDEEVGLFDRFTVMRHWRETEKLGFDQFVTADGLHMNDWGYACVAKLLAAAIIDGVKLPPSIARAASLQH